MTLSDRRARYLLALAASLIAGFGFYYWVHKPVTPAQAAALASVLADLSAALLLTLIGGGLGRWLLRRWHRGEQPLDLTAGERIGAESALGWGAIGLAMLGLGLAGGYYPGLAWSFSLAALAILRRDVRDWLADSFHAAGTLISHERISRLAAMFVLFTLSLGLLRALAPPLMWDALVYHLTLPKLYAQAHRVWPGTDTLSVFSGMPQLAEMLYTAAFLLRGEITAQTLGWAFGLVLALGLAAQASALLGARWAALAPAILFSSFSITLSLAWAYGDLLLMLLSSAMLIALRQWSMNRGARWLSLAGVFAGLAVGCKYTGFIVPIAGAAIIAITPSALGVTPQVSRFTHHVSRVAYPLARFALPAFLVISPWFLKNWAFTGSPIYPLLIPAWDMDELRMWFYHRPDLVERDPLWAALILFRAAFSGVQGGNEYDVTLGPLLAMLPLALAVGWRGLEGQARGDVRLLVVFVLVGYAGWVTMLFMSSLALQARLFWAFFPALALLGTAGVAACARLDVPGLRLTPLLGAAVALAFGLSAVEHLSFFVRRGPLAYVLGLQSAADYRVANLGWYPLAIDRINRLPAGTRVMFLWEARSLACSAPVRCVPDVIIDRWWHLRRSRTGGDVAAIAARWKAEHVTHVLIYETGREFAQTEVRSPFAEADWAELETLRGQMRLVEDVGGAYSLYELP